MPLPERLRPRVVAIILAGLSTGGAHAAPTPEELGRRLYQEGIRADGSPLSGRGAGGIVQSGKPAACIQCHRRSGMGGSEGRIRVAPLAGPLLFAAARPFLVERSGRTAHATPLRQDARPAYDETTLVRALRSGLDPSGQQLNPAMPRYRIDDADAANLAAYLRTLSPQPAPGIEGRTMHLATIVAPDADPERAQVMIETLDAWAKTGGFVGMTLRLHVWRLEGAAHTWGRQLDDLQRATPVYAVLSGTGANWAPVASFCEQRQLPCLFPLADAAPDDAGAFFSMYFSTGVTQEARMLARHFATLPARPTRIVQLVADEPGRAAAAALAAEMPTVPLETRVWSAGDPAGALADLDGADAIVAWLRPPQLAALARALPAGPRAGNVYLSAQLAPPDRTNLSPVWKPLVRWISVHTDPLRLRGNTVLGLMPWLERLGLELRDETVQSAVYGAIFFFGDAQARMRGRFDQAYLLETLELAVDNRPAGASYYGLSLGPGQRVAVKGGHLLGYRKTDDAVVAPLGPRLLAGG